MFLLRSITSGLYVGQIKCWENWMLGKWLELDNSVTWLATAKHGLFKLKLN